MKQYKHKTKGWIVEAEEWKSESEEIGPVKKITDKQYKVFKNTMTGYLFPKNSCGFFQLFKMIVRPSDWVIRGLPGFEYYVLSNASFVNDFEEVKEIN